MKMMVGSAADNEDFHSTLCTANPLIAIMLYKFQADDKLRVSQWYKFDVFMMASVHIFPRNERFGDMLIFLIETLQTRSYLEDDFDGTLKLKPFQCKISKD